MPALTGVRGQGTTPGLPYPGSITTGGTPQLIRPISPGRVYLLVQNTSTGPMWLGLGGAQAKATLTSGSVSSVSVINAGFGFTYPPQVVFSGGGRLQPFIGNTMAPDGLGGGYGFPAPANPATAVAVLSTGAVSSITVTNGGSGYVATPDVFLFNDPRDPFGAFSPSSGAGFYLSPNGGSFVMESTTFISDQVSIYGATTGQTYDYREAY